MKNKKKVLHVITNFSARGGAEAMLSRVLRGMSNEDEDHFVISLLRVNSDFFCEDLSYDFYELRLDGVFGVLRFFKAIYLAIGYSPTVVVGWMYHGCIASTIFSLFCLKRNVWNVRHSLDDLSVESISTRLSIWFCRILSFFPMAIIYNSEKALGQHALYGFSGKRAVYIPNGFYVEDFNVRPSDSPIKNKILCVGRNHPSKGFAGFLKMLVDNSFFYEHKEATLTVVGRGVTSLVSVNEALVKNGQLILIEEMPDLSYVYSRYDYFVLTSLNEGFPNVLCEAAISGLVCLSTVAGDSEAILGDDGLIFDRLDYGSFCSAFNYASNLIRDAKSLDEFRSSFLNRYSIGHVLNEYRLVFFN